MSFDSNFEGESWFEGLTDQDIWNGFSEEHRSRYKEPFILSLNYHPDKPQNLDGLRLIVSGFEDESAEDISFRTQSRIVKHFPFIKSFDFNTPACAPIDRSNGMKDETMAYRGIYTITDDAKMQESIRIGPSFVSETGIPREYFRGYGLHVSLDPVNSRNAAEFVYNLLSDLKVAMPRNIREYLALMDSKNVGISAKKEASRLRKKALLMEVVKPTFLEKVEITLSPRLFFGQKVSDGKLDSILWSGR